MTLDLETQAARLFTVGFHGKAVSDDLSRLLARGVGGVVKVVRVFEVLSESELAQTQPKTLAQPDTAASAAVVRP